MGGLLYQNPMRGLLSEPESKGALYGLLGSGLRAMPSGMGLSPFGLRHSGMAPKGLGFFGAIPASQGYSTEISSEFDLKGKPVEHPLLVPTLTADEIKHLVGGGEPTQEIYRKAQEFAMQRMHKGLNPFAGPSELRYPMPR